MGLLGCLATVRRLASPHWARQALPGQASRTGSPAQVSKTLEIMYYYRFSHQCRHHHCRN
jgi:hypothetical protein